MTSESEISDWIVNAVKEVRKESSATESGSSDAHPGGIISYEPPSQFEAFWINKPIELLLILRSKDEGRKDLETIVNGPINFENFLDKVEDIIQSPRWQQVEPVPPYIQNIPDDYAARGELLAPEFSRVYEMADGLLTNEANKELHISSIINNIICIYIYDISEENILKSIKGSTRIMKDLENIEMEESDSEESIGSGTYIYPPVWVGSVPEMSFSEKVLQAPDNFAETVIEDSISGNKLSVQKDGFIYVDIGDPEKAIDMFNCIFAAGLFKGEVMDSVKAGGVTDTTDPESEHERFGIFSQLRKDLTPSNSPAPLSQRTDPPRRGIINKDDMISIISLAESIYKNNEEKQKASFLLQAYTHHRNNEFSQSYLFSWILIENHINHSLRSHLKDTREMSSTRVGKVIDSSNWGASNKIELAEIIGHINKSKYSELNSFRKKRNKLVHNMAEVDKKDSAEILNAAFEMLYKDDITPEDGSSQIPGL